MSAAVSLTVNASFSALVVALMLSMLWFALFVGFGCLTAWASALRRLESIRTGTRKLWRFSAGTDFSARLL